MAITINHPFVSAKGDGSDATLVRPSNWNASHNINMATNRVIGRLTAGPGLAEELPVTSYMMNLLNTADYAALAVLLGLPTTGDAKLTFKLTADAGWILANDGTIGDVGSGASTAAANTSALFTHFYNNFSDAICPVQTSAGAGTTRAAQGTASIAFGTNKCRMVIPKILGRALIIAGSGAGLSTRTLGDIGGSETTTLTTAMIPKHTHTATGWALASTSINGTPTGSTSTTLSGSTGFRDAQHVHNTDIGSTGSGGSYAAGYNLDHAHTGGATFGIFTSGGYINVGTANGLTYGGSANTGGSGTLDHAHYTDPGNTSSGVELGGIYGDGSHKHAQTGTFTGTCSVNTWTGVTVSGTIGGTTDVMSVGDGAHTNMQPWTAWNVMIRL